MKKWIARLVLLMFAGGICWGITVAQMWDVVIMAFAALSVLAAFSAALVWAVFSAFPKGPRR